MRNSVSTEEFRVDGGIPCRRRNSVSTEEFRVDGGIPCRRRNSVSTEEFRVDGGIPCWWGNSMSTGEFRVVGGIPCQHVYLQQKVVAFHGKRLYKVMMWLLSTIDICTVIGSCQKVEIGKSILEPSRKSHCLHRVCKTYKSEKHVYNTYSTAKPCEFSAGKLYLSLDSYKYIKMSLAFILRIFFKVNTLYHLIWIRILNYFRGNQLPR
jgi:hypothetical protein